MTTIVQSGQQVRVGRNDVNVPAGSTGRFLGIVAETGRFLVEVGGRRVSLDAEAVILPHGEPIAPRCLPASAAAAAEPSSSAQQPGTPLSRTPYLIASDTAAELGASLGVVQQMAKALGVGQCSGRICRYTPAEIAKLRQFHARMKRFKVRSVNTMLSIERVAAEMVGDDDNAE